MSELYHWGVKGMKWGVRRYQNKDGSRTNTGKKKLTPEQKRARTKKLVAIGAAAATTALAVYGAKKLVDSKINIHERAARNATSKATRRKIERALDAIANMPIDLRMGEVYIDRSTGRTITWR